MIIIETKPEGGMVTFDDGDTCLAPCSTRVKRSRPISFAVERGDCRKTEKNIPPLIDHGFGHSVFYANMGLGQLLWLVGDSRTLARFLGHSLLGLALSYVDGWTGANIAHRPSPVIVELDCGNGSVSDESSNSRIF